ncbi:hypothetical protein HYFRA_00007316, partial [Hymenoscyphus fraxineus]
MFTSWLLLIYTFIPTLVAANFIVGEKFQIVLNGIPNLSKTLVPSDALVWDVDLEDTSAETIAAMKDLGKTVICYFSAGTSENWRPDFSRFAASDMGTQLKEWPNERWLRLSSGNVRSIMKMRIQMAQKKGCDAVDPDNTDGYQNTNGLNLKETDTIEYLKFLASYASSLGLKIGLKNSLSVLPSLTNLMSFAVNEECGKFGECTQYNNFIKAGKPVYHIEYISKPPAVTTDERKVGCQSPGMTGFSTVLKNMTLSGWVAYCDGSEATTDTSPGGVIPGKPPGGHPTSTVTASTTGGSSTDSPEPPEPTGSSTSSSTSVSTKFTTTTKPTSTKTSSTSKPTSTQAPGGGNGCKQKHWDQCGGTDWKGCTVCA